MDIERRFTPTSEIRVSGDEGNTLEGLGVVYDRWSDDLGGFIERIRPGAGLRSISENQEIYSTYNHNDNYVLGRVSAETLSLFVNNDGIKYKVNLPDTSFANDLKVSINRKDVKGSSVRFIVTEDVWGMKGSLETRDVIDFELYELGPVTNPAYPQTTAGVRSTLYKLGIDYEALYRAILKSQNDNQEERDVDVIASAIEALQKYLPSPQVDLEGDAEPDQTGLVDALKLRLRML